MAGKGLTLQISAALAGYLVERGGRSHRGKGSFNRSRVLARSMEALRCYQELTDPRVVSGFPEELHALVVRLVPEPWALRRFEILHLEGLLASTPGFARAVAAAGCDAMALVEAVAAMSAAEKLTLVDHAIQHQAPAAASATEE